MIQNTKHKDVIIAWLNGAKVQGRNPSSSITACRDWGVIKTPAWKEDWEYRVKPTITKKYCNVYADGETGVTYSSRKASDDGVFLRIARTAVLISEYEDGNLINQRLEKISGTGE